MLSSRTCFFNKFLGQWHNSWYSNRKLPIIQYSNTHLKIKSDGNIQARQHSFPQCGCMCIEMCTPWQKTAQAERGNAPYIIVTKSLAKWKSRVYRIFWGCCGFTKSSFNLSEKHSLIHLFFIVDLTQSWSLFIFVCFSSRQKVPTSVFKLW